MQRKLKVINICYFLTLVFVYLVFLNKMTLTYIKQGYGLINSLLVAATSYDMIPFVVTGTILAEFTVYVIIENLEGTRKTKYKENKSMRGKKKPKVYEVANLMTTIHVKERKRKLGVYLDDYAETDEISMGYLTVLTYRDPETDEVIEIELTEKEVYECVETDKKYKAKITIEYSKHGDVIGTQIEIPGL